MSTSLFQPAVSVSDNGVIQIDWFDCYVNTVDGDSDDIEVAYGEPEGQPHSTLLDSIIGDHRAEPAVALRRLADYIERREMI